MRKTRIASFLPVRVRTQTCIIIGTIVLSLFIPLRVEGIEVATRITDREIVESLVAIRGDIKRIDQRFDSMEKQIDQRFKSVDERFDSIDKRFDELKGFMLWGFGVIFAGMFSLIGFVLWDRRTALSPAIRKNRELEEREEKIERILREYAMKEPKMAEVLKHLGLL